MSKFSQKLRPLASAAIFYYATLWLSVLVVVGTINQKFFGLRHSLEKYFSAWFVQPMDMPLWLPAGRFTMAVILISLSAKLIIGSKWRIKNIGINITHLGVFCLMLGGVITAYTTTEGNMAIPEGAESSSYQDFHEVEIAVTDRADPEFDATTTFTDGFFTNDQTFTDSRVPMSFKVLRWYKNCEPVARPADERLPEHKDRAANIMLKELPTDNDDRNLGGVEVEVSGLAPTHNGTYVLISHPGWKPAIVTGEDGKTYELFLRARHHQLPFSIYLKDFEKLDHAGTSMARAFSSKVRVTQGASTEDKKIYMNHPLRRNGYTLYQASFSQAATETTVLQVVHNKGQLMPYISIVIITVGLLIHVIMQIPRLIVAAQTKNPARNIT